MTTLTSNADFVLTLTRSKMKDKLALLTELLGDNLEAAGITVDNVNHAAVNNFLCNREAKRIVSQIPKTVRTFFDSPTTRDSLQSPGLNIGYGIDALSQRLGNKFNALEFRIDTVSCFKKDPRAVKSESTLPSEDVAITFIHNDDPEVSEEHTLTVYVSHISDKGSIEAISVSRDLAMLQNIEYMAIASIHLNTDFKDATVTLNHGDAFQLLGRHL